MQLSLPPSLHYTAFASLPPCLHYTALPCLPPTALQELGLDETTLLSEIEQILGFGSLSSKPRSEHEATPPTSRPVKFEKPVKLEKPKPDPTSYHYTQPQQPQPQPQQQQQQQKQKPAVPERDSSRVPIVLLHLLLTPPPPPHSCNPSPSLQTLSSLLQPSSLTPNFLLTPPTLPSS
ncbi:hypothetical protein Pmani_028334 [Petrolisthes manimaculis]|uniref:Uncharacterized protein n=1 Tax=Petrolisthes manimaculis TaxID=1843537 RepID=A0AAE1P0B1_9EUCA|nr:hypothetical protein Pmani_028334 [Petrolisthes manimaculis]